jgi:DNA-binding FadR family transcriptional regulator
MNPTSDINRFAMPPPFRSALRAVPAGYFELLPAQEKRSQAEHAALLRAMGRGDAAKARVLAEAHVLEAGGALGEWRRTQQANDAHGKR